MNPGKQDKQQGEGNRLIADGNLSIMLFDGWKKESRQTFDPDHNTQNPGSNTYYVYVKNGREVRPEDIEFDIVYHQNWDALMPIVEKIAATPSISITIESFTVENGDKIVGSCEIKRTFWPQHGVVNTEPIAYKKEFAEKLSVIKIVWDCVIQFIKWYNTNSK